ncbi:MAG: hypothetical protein PHE09_08075 [Oscillospiraceae bacterium]|nr:hypothetical protein [Oscillospiraceae bacterium]
MNGYICTKTCNIGGVAYSKGDAIPFESVLPSRERALIKQGYIASSGAAADAKATPDGTDSMSAYVAELEANTKAMIDEMTSMSAHIARLEAAATTPPGTPTEGDQETSAIVVPITTKEGVLELSLAPEDVITAITTLQLNADDAAKAVGTIENEETLILIDALDARKTVKTAITEKVKAMGNGEGEESKGDA